MFKKVLTIAFCCFLLLSLFSVVSAEVRRDVDDYFGSSTSFAREKVNYSLFNAEKFTGTRVDITGNLTLGQKITFAFGEMIDNIVDGWIKITGNLEVSGNVNITQNLTVGQSVLFVDSTDNFVGFGIVESTEDRQIHILMNGTKDIFVDGTTNLRMIDTGVMRFEHKPGIDNTRAITINIDNGNMENTHAMVINFDANKMDEIAVMYEANVDTSEATSGKVRVYEATRTGNSNVEVHGLHINPGVFPVVQVSGIFEAPAHAWDENGGFTDVTTAFGSMSTNVTIFDADDDKIYIGGDTVFESIELILNTVASGSGVAPTFEISDGVGGWITNIPNDITRGLRQSGLISIVDQTGWGSQNVNGETKFWYRITRTANFLTTPPIETTILISSTKRYFWDENGNLLVNEINITGNLTIGERIIQDNYSIYPVILNDNVIDSAFCLEMNSPDGDKHCKLVIQPGGDGQASIIRRSFSIVNDEACSGVNATNMQCYADVGGFTWNIDFNTSLSGADVGIADDLEVIGEIWLRNSAGQPKFLTRTLDLLDELFEDIFFNDANLTIVSGVLNINDTLNETLVININRTETITDSKSDSISLNSGTDLNPAVNHITYQNPDNPVLTISTSEPTVKHAEVSVIYVGASENVYLFENTISHNEKFIDNTYDTFSDFGGIYLSGLNTLVNTTTMNITDGKVRLRSIKTTYTNELNSVTDGFFYINNVGEFINCVDNTCLTDYEDGTEISNNKDYTIVWGVVPVGDQQRLMVILQSNPGSGKEYVSAIDAEEDILSQANFFPSNVDFKPVFIPIARTIHRRTGNNDFVEFPTTDELFQDLRGKATVGSGGVPSPPITDHDLFNKLEWFEAGHLFASIGKFFNIGSYNFTTTGNITADWINASSDICIEGGNCLSSVSGAAGIWTNVSGIATYDGGVNITDTLMLLPQLSPSINTEGGVFYNSSLQTLMVNNGTDWRGLSGVPQGSIIGFEGSCPVGYTETDESLSTKRDKVGAWVSFAGDTCSGTCTIADSFNVANVTHIGTGNYRVYFSRPFADNNYAAVSSVNRQASTVPVVSHTQALGIDAFDIRTHRTDSGAAINQEVNFAIAIGEDTTSLTYCEKVGQDVLETSSGFWGNVADKLFVNNVSWKVGIGTTTPTKVLDVLGDILFTGFLDVVGNLSVSGDVQVNGKLGLGSASELTISSGNITITKAYHTVDTEADAATDNLDNINGGVDGDIIIIRQASSPRDVTLRDNGGGTGNLRLAGGSNFMLSNTQSTIRLVKTAVNWLEVSRSLN